MGVRYKALPLLHVARKRFRPLGHRFHRGPGSASTWIGGSGDQARIACCEPGVARNDCCKTATVPCAGAAYGFVHVGATGGNFIFLFEVRMPFGKIANLLSFLFLLMSFLLIVRNSLAGQVRMFAIQSGILAALAAVVASFGGRLELFGVAAVLTIIKVIVIPNVLNRTVARIGMQRAVAPYLGTSTTLAVCAVLVVIAFTAMSPITGSD